ncbi:MAG: VanW family protein [Sarcina sp.]
MGDSKEVATIEKKEKRKLHWYLVIAIIAIILGALGAYIYSINSLADSFENKIYPKVLVNEIDLGGKTKEEAKALLEKEFGEKVKEKKLTLKVGENEVTVDYNKINPILGIDETVDKAIAYGKNENIFSKNKLIKNGVNATVGLGLSYDEESVENFKKELKKKVNKKHKDATISVSSGNVSVVPEENGMKVNEDDLNKIVSENLNSTINELNLVKEVSTEVDEAKINSKMLANINGKIGGSSTNFNAGDWQRTTNLKIATGHINGVLLMPGETFSYNDVVGERLASRGFMNGAGFIGNKVVPTIGGGVCQISTTLYQAISNSGILPTERHPHSMLVTYANPSEDAAVAWEVLDYKFKNTYDFPIYIEGYLTGSTVYFNVYGDKEALGGKTFKLVGVTNSKGGNYAATSTGYLVTYENGKEIDRKLIKKDSYRNKAE